jgi:hypothetical protein
MTILWTVLVWLGVKTAEGLATVAMFIFIRLFFIVVIYYAADILIWIWVKYQVMVIDWMMTNLWVFILQQLPTLSEVQIIGFGGWLIKRLRLDECLIIMFSYMAIYIVIGGFKPKAAPKPPAWL